MLKAGLIGCGNISGIYLQNQSVFGSLVKITCCADLRQEAAEAQAEKYGIRAVSVEELLADPEIDIVLNLTTPQSHAEIALRALEAGKHIYAEKPFALNREDGQKILECARSRNLRTGSAPDTFLGGGHQTCRALVDEGVIGKVHSGMAFMLCPGHEHWHPAPAFYYQKGGGPLFDMGPYYLTALINMLGPVRQLSARSNRMTDLRQGRGVNQGKTFPVEIDTHISALLEFECGALITLTTSFDVRMHSNYRDIELYGTNGSLHTPDPNCFDGEIRFMQSNLTAGWAVAQNRFGYNQNMRSLGLADMAQAIETGRAHRASGELAYHVLDVMCAIVESAADGNAKLVESSCTRPAPLTGNL